MAPPTTEPIRQPERQPRVQWQPTSQVQYVCPAVFCGQGYERVTNENVIDIVGLYGHIYPIATNEYITHFVSLQTRIVYLVISPPLSTNLYFRIDPNDTELSFVENETGQIGAHLCIYANPLMVLNP